MSYRGPQMNRIIQQRAEVMQYAGHVVTWKQYVSGVSGNAVLGLGDTLYYHQQPISAHMVFSANSELPRPAGQMIDQTLYAVTTVELNVRDELLWKGEIYRVQSPSQPSKIAGQWNTRLELGDN